MNDKNTTTVTRYERYVVNGKEYGSLAEIPEPERSQVARILEDKNADGIPDILQGRGRAFVTSSEVHITKGERASSDTRRGTGQTRNWTRTTSLTTPHRFTARNVLGIAWVALLLLSLGFGIAGMFMHFLTSAAYTQRMGIPASVVALVVVAPIAYVTFMDSPLEGWRWKVLAPVAMIVLFFVFRNALLQGVPAVFHRLSDVPAERVVTVTKPSTGYGKNCGYNADVHHAELAEGRVCGIFQSTWKRIAMGDELKLTGSSSYFGFAYDSDLVAKMSSASHPSERRALATNGKTAERHWIDDPWRRTATRVFRNPTRTFSGRAHAFLHQAHAVAVVQAPPVRLRFLLRAPLESYRSSACGAIQWE